MKKGQYKCKVCKGIGEIKNPNNSKLFIYPEYIKCPNCKGYGYLDWIENIVGKQMSENEEIKEVLLEALKSSQLEIVSGRK